MNGGQKAKAQTPPESCVHATRRETRAEASPRFSQELSRLTVKAWPHGCSRLALTRRKLCFEDRIVLGVLPVRPEANPGPLVL